MVEVRRPDAVHAASFDLHGRPIELKGEDFVASLLQHEIDHLDGILTLQRADPAERCRAITELSLATHRRTDAPTRRAA